MLGLLLLISYINDPDDNVLQVVNRFVVEITIGGVV